MAAAERPSVGQPLSMPRFLSEIFVAERDTLAFRIWTIAVGCASFSLVGVALLFLLSDFGRNSAATVHPNLGWFLGIAAIVLAVQTIWTARRGYVFCGPTEYVEKANHQVLYRVWLTLQCMVIASIGAIATAIVTSSTR